MRQDVPNLKPNSLK